MKITFLGGADEVGASSTLVEISGKRILVDCGIRPSPKARYDLAGDQLPNLEQIVQPDVILVTHAHTDHTGGLELVTDRFPDVPVYATAPTIALTRVLHQDARRIMQSRLDEEGELPLFDDVSVQRLMSAFVSVPFRTRLKLAENLAVTFYPAGHIAGAAMLALESDEGNILFTGDLSISPQRTIDGAKPPDFYPDVLIIESTYGGRLHANRAIQERKLIETVGRVTAEGGKVLIPAFALGRAQEILLILSEFQRNGGLSPVPVWADGMVRSICQAYTGFAEVLAKPLQEREARFFEGQIRPVQTFEQRNALVWQPGAAVIVASSGMLAGGPSLSYARTLAKSSQNAILLTGYQDEESPGRRLQELAEKGSGTLRLGNEKVDVQCHLGTYSLSAHADEAQLISFTETLHPQHVILVHGDEGARSSLEKALRERSRIVHLPRAGQTLVFQFENRKSGQPAAAAADLRARQKAITRERLEQMRGFSGAAGKWLMLKGEEPVLARCLFVEGDHLWVEISSGLEQAVYPEEILVVFSDTRPAEEEMALYQPSKPAPALMEPNQALAFASQHMPPSARLRKVGYRLGERILILTLDFPDAHRQETEEAIESLKKATGWRVNIFPETNQAALNSLLKELLPADWQIVKGPAIHRDQKRVAVTAAPPLSSTPQENDEQVQTIAQRYLSETGFELTLTLSAPAVSQVVLRQDRGSDRLEINSAYSLIKSSLQGTTLYRTSLKGDEIVLSFISPQVGARYREQIETVAAQVGWPLVINPQPNQGAILETARAMFTDSGWKVAKGPSIYPDKAEINVSLGNTPAEEEILDLAARFENETGYRLAVNITQPVIQNSQPKKMDQASVEIPVAQIRLQSFQTGLSIDPGKLEKAIARARMLGITPPIKVRRSRDGYILVDGLYRLRAAQALKMLRIPALVE